MLRPSSVVKLAAESCAARGSSSGGPAQLIGNQIQLRACRLIDTALLHILGDADDREPDVWRPAARLQALSDRIATAPDRARQRFVTTATRRLAPTSAGSKPRPSTIGIPIVVK
jgi:hypothetical protein